MEEFKQLKTRFSEYLDLFVMALGSPQFWLSPVWGFCLSCHFPARPMSSERSSQCGLKDRCCV